MNFTEQSNNLPQNGANTQIARTCSASSNSTANSNIPQQNSTSPKEALTSLKKTALKVQPLKTAQKPQNELKSVIAPFQLSPYLKKRKAIMQWFETYCQQLGITKTSLASAQLYSDMLFHNHALPQPMKPTLLSILILASKYYDNPVLYTGEAANICNVSIDTLLKLEQETCRKLNYKLGSATYAIRLDNIIAVIKRKTNLWLYEQKQDYFVALSAAFAVASCLYGRQRSDGKIGVSQSELWAVIQLCINWYIITKQKQQQQNNPNKIIDNIQSIDNTMDHNQLQNIQNLFEQCPKPAQQQTYLIGQIFQEWRNKKQAKIRQKFRNRKQNGYSTSTSTNTSTYGAFSVKYHG